MMGLKMPEDEDVASTRIILRNTENARSVSSWLSASLGPSDSHQPNSQDDDTDGDEFTGFGGEESGLPGLGFVTPDGQPQDRHLLSANEKLRKQLLGKGHSKLTAAKPRPHAVTKQSSDDSEEDSKGRSHLGNRKSKGKPTISVRDEFKSPVKQNDDVDKLPAVGSRKKRPMSYLDQVLAEREAKKNRKRQQKSKPADGED